MPEERLIEIWQRQKRILLLVAVLGMSFLLLCLNLRFIPSINDRLSGKPEYMRWVANELARSLAGKIGDDFPVIVLKDEKGECKDQSNPGAFDADDLYYVLTYSESSQSVCFLTCAKATTVPAPDYAIQLSQESGHNYGRKLSSPAAVVPIGHVSVSLPASYLSLLHWRATIDPSKFAHVGDAKVQRSLAQGLPVSFVNVSLDFASLRAAVAERHNTVNAMLTSLIVLSSALVAVAFAWTWILYRRFRTLLTPYRAHVAFWAFFRNNLTTISQNACETHRSEQARLLEEARAAALLRRSKDAVRAHLESMYNVLTDDDQRRRIRDCLLEDDIEQMKSLAQHLLDHVGQRTPEERLASLLATLQDYCTGEELDQCSTEAFQILAARGFREARSFVVEAHAQFRARAKELEKKEIMEVE